MAQLTSEHSIQPDGIIALNERGEIREKMPNQRLVLIVPSARRVRRDKTIWRVPQRMGRRQWLWLHDVKISPAQLP
jgi:hypothetical protein